MRTRLFFIAWLAGLPGIVVTVLLVVPTMLAKHTLPLPLWAMLLASGTQSALLLALAAFAGAALGCKVDLRAPVLSAIVQRGPVLGALRRQIVPGLVGGVAGAALLMLFSGYVPQVLAQVEKDRPMQMPALVRLLYGGITEEVLIRWGLMTAIVWLLRRIAQGGQGTPSRAVMWVAILVSALLFGAGHLPAVFAFVGKLPLDLVAYIVCANAAFGVVAGWLYWRFGLESAMLAHMTVHVLLLILAP